MATIHATTLAPSKLELRAPWLPRQAWFTGTVSSDLVRAGGFRLDDPAGEVGIELMVVADRGRPDVAWFVPLNYRGAPLAGAVDALIGTSEHGVLGTRWIYDAEHDPVALEQVLAFVRSAVETQHQTRSDTPDRSVGRSWDGGPPGAVELFRVPEAGAVVRARGRVEVGWTRPDGSSARGTVAVVR